MSTTTIPNDSVFPTMPSFPSIRTQTDTAYGIVGSGKIVPRQYPPGTFKPIVRWPPPLKVNKIYFNKKALSDSFSQRHAEKGSKIHKIWEIPFSCDVEIPVTELTQRIFTVMEKTDNYIEWNVDFSRFIIRAIEK